MLPLDRRSFLVASTVGAAGLVFGRPVPASTTGAPPAGRAKSTILFFLCGGASHIDTWDMKPDAPAEYRGAFQPMATSAAGIRLCEHLPRLAQQAHHLAIVRSVAGTVNTNDHHAGYYHNLTGHVPDQSFRTLGNNRTPFPDDWPYMGCVVGMKRPPHPFLPNAITLPHKPSKAPYTRPGQFGARLGIEHDPLYVQGDFDHPLRFEVPALTLQGALTPTRLADRRGLLGAIDEARHDFDRVAGVRSLGRQQQRAFSLLGSSRVTEAFNVAAEPVALRERYGQTINGMSLLLARRLAEAEVPFITVFWKENEAIAERCKSAGGWDTHGNNFNCLREHLLPEFDRAFATLIDDLHQRGMLEQTLLLVTSEMGRTPRIGDPRSGGVCGAGRDHWTHCLSVLMAGGGIRGGQAYGASDRFAEYPIDRVVTPAHIARTVYHAMGVSDLTAMDREGRPYHLLPEAEMISGLFT